MPVPRPAYGRKPGPFVTPPDKPSKQAAAKAQADLARNPACDAAVAVAIMTATSILG
jgi:hypothetical protein